LEKLNILQLVPRFPFPSDDGGKIGIANIYIQFSSLGANVTLFSLGNEHINSDILSDAQKHGNVQLYSHNTKNTTLKILKSVLLNHSIYIKKHYSKKILKTLCRLCEKNKFDIIHADHTCMAPLAIKLRKKYQIPCGLRLHNIEWLIWKRYSDELPPYSPQRMYIKHQAKLLKQQEKNIISKININFAITEKDKKRALELAPDAKIIVASAGVNPYEWKPDYKIQRNTKELILASTFRWIHNINAIEWFIKKVLPIIEKEIPDIQFTIIGKDIPEKLKNNYTKTINFLGYVDKVQPYYNKASVNIAPLFVGSGIRIKILEAMAMELPVVASPIAAEGIYAKSKNGLFIAKGKEEFANQIINLITDPHKTRQLGKAARKFVLENYSWKKNVGMMLEEYKKLVKV
jgi:polysaccharide biosynthesis protein PslH